MWRSDRKLSLAPASSVGSGDGGHLSLMSHPNGPPPFSTVIILSILEVIIILLLIFLRKRILIAIALIKEASRWGLESQGRARGLRPGHLSLMSVSVSPQSCGTCHVLHALPTGDLLPLVSLHCLLGQHFCVSTALVSLGSSGTCS